MRATVRPDDRRQRLEEEREMKATWRAWLAARMQGPGVAKKDERQGARKQERKEARKEERRQARKQERQEMAANPAGAESSVTAAGTE